MDRQVSQGRSEGASVRRLEDRRFLNGGGEYLADMQRPGMVEAAFLRSPIAHGRIAAVGIPDQYRDRVFLARDLPPVKPIVADSAAKGFKHSEYPPLAGKKVRFVGEMVAVCLGPTRAEAEDIAQACTLEIDELPALWDIDIALASDAPRVHDSWPDNIFVETRIETGDLAALKHQAPVIVKRQLRMGRHAGVPMEGRGVLAHYDRPEPVSRMRCAIMSRGIVHPRHRCRT